MVDTISPGIGTIFSAVASLPAANTSTGYAALTWVATGEVTEVPEYGAESATVTHTPLATGIVAKYHGEENMGSMSIPLAISRADAGQIILRSAQTSKARISFKIAYPDGTFEYFQGKVMSFKISSSGGSVVSGTCMIEIETRPVIKLPA